MRLSEVFIETQVRAHPRAQHILSKLKHLPLYEIDSVDDYFGKTKKPYLQKRKELKVFVGKKKGALIKKTPDAYGVSGMPHYYFVNAYNCIYECEYCFLQGYFDSPDLVFFIDDNEVENEVDRLLSKHHYSKVWFHAGEFSDSLAMSHITDELSFYFDLFKTRPSALLELRTKSAQIKALLAQSPLPNVITSFSLASASGAVFDRKCAPLETRIEAIQKLQTAGHTVALHLDPIIYSPNLEAEYSELLELLSMRVNLSAIAYISLGVVRFAKNVFKSLKQHYPNSPMLSMDFIDGQDQKMRYIRPLRQNMLKQVKNICLNAGIDEGKIYLCMEESVHLEGHSDDNTGNEKF